MTHGHAVHHDRAGTRRGRAGHRGGDPGEIGVRSLQEWAADLASLRAAQDAARSTGADGTTTTTTQDGDR